MNLVEVTGLVAQFPESFGQAIPQIITLLTHTNRGVRMVCADVISKLSEQSKISNFLPCILLMYL